MRGQHPASLPIRRYFLVVHLCPFPKDVEDFSQDTCLTMTMSIFRYILLVNNYIWRYLNMSPRPRKQNSDKSPIAIRLCDYFGNKQYLDISDKIGMSITQVSDYLNGRTPPSSKLLEYVARNGGDVNYILTGEKRSPTAPNALTPAQKLVLSHLKTLFDMLLETYHEALADPEEAEEIAAFFENIASTLTRKAQ